MERQWWKSFILQGIVYLLAGLLETYLAAYLASLYVGYLYAKLTVAGKQFLGVPPPEKMVLVGLYFSAILVGQLWFALGMVTVRVAERWL
ncbi:xanthosine utilization system XapX-like protein [Aminobacter aminovorans]|uniref:Xanthosine utilization system XapX-like protein n=1 Tax=Aminobacter aminovorans TaxID=83263 RepID=A0AAC8YSC8_AMIAI|nr:hypothetical protein AA2016_4506 [Aminobacter aminovorans]MBB3705445.1 xanthosine utilization system XapX-like protein [Aminobacter aminovorans]